VQAACAFERSVQSELNNVEAMCVLTSRYLAFLISLTTLGILYQIRYERFAQVFAAQIAWQSRLTFLDGLVMLRHPPD
jgi:hypothetical protein